jgi:hypothetical protein
MLYISVSQNDLTQQLLVVTFNGRFSMLPITDFLNVTNESRIGFKPINNQYLGYQ